MGSDTALLNGIILQAGQSERKVRFLCFNLHDQRCDKAQLHASMPLKEYETSRYTAIQSQE